MRPPVTRPGRPRALAVLGVGALLLLYACWVVGGDLPHLLRLHAATTGAFVAAVAVGELVRLPMPSGREAAPLASASVMGLAVIGLIEGEPPFDVSAAVVVLIVAAGTAVAAVVRRLRGLGVGAGQAAARLLGAGVAAGLARGPAVDGRTLWDVAIDQSVPREVVGLGMVFVATVGVVVETVLTAGVRAERQRSPWPTALRDELGEVAPLTYAVVASGPLVALMAPVFGLASLPAALFPLAITYVAVARYARNRATYRQTIATLSELTERGGYTPPAHAGRVADLSVRIGRVLGMQDDSLREVEYAALLHDLGQISLSEPLPDGATVLAAPHDQHEIAMEGGRIIRAAEALETVAGYVEAQTTRYRQVLELGEPVALASRIIKVANAFDDLTGGRHDPGSVEAAMERIHLGLGYEYDPAVVGALEVATADAPVSRLAEREPAAR
jgi:hypothetical protein